MNQFMKFSVLRIYLVEDQNQLFLFQIEIRVNLVLTHFFLNLLLGHALILDLFSLRPVFLSKHLIHHQALSIEM